MAAEVTKTVRNCARCGSHFVLEKTFRNSPACQVPAMEPG